MEPEVVILAVFALWPVLGIGIFALVNRRLRRSRGGIIPPASSGGEILARMYLWPLVLFKYLRR